MAILDGKFNIQRADMIIIHFAFWPIAGFTTD
jgi:hypothetical protein